MYSHDGTAGYKLVKAALIEIKDVLNRWNQYK